MLVLNLGLEERRDATVEDGVPVHAGEEGLRANLLGALDALGDVSLKEALQQATAFRGKVRGENKLRLEDLQSIHHSHEKNYLCNLDYLHD